MVRFPLAPSLELDYAADVHLVLVGDAVVVAAAVVATVLGVAVAAVAAAIAVVEAVFAAPIAAALTASVPIAVAPVADAPAGLDSQLVADVLEVGKSVGAGDGVVDDDVHNYPLVGHVPHNCQSIDQL